MASKETAELIVEAIDYYVSNNLMPAGNTSDVEVMRKVIKYDDIKKSLTKKED